MEKLTEYHAEQYITSHMVSFLAQSRPFAGASSKNGMRRFYSQNVSDVQRAQMNEMPKFMLNTTIGVVLKRLKIKKNTSRSAFWFVGQHFTTRLIFIDLANNSHYSDILVSNDAISNAVIAKAKSAGVFFDFRRVGVMPMLEAVSVHN